MKQEIIWFSADAAQWHRKHSVISIKRLQRHGLLTVLAQPFIIPGAIISEKLHFIL